MLTKSAVFISLSQCPWGPWKMALSLTETNDLLLTVNHKGLTHSRPLTPSPCSTPPAPVPPLDLVCIAHGGTSQHNAYHIKKKKKKKITFNAPYYTGGHRRQVNFSAGRLSPESTTAASWGLHPGFALPPFGTSLERSVGICIDQPFQVRATKGRASWNGKRHWTHLSGPQRQDRPLREVPLERGLRFWNNPLCM